MIFVHEPPVVRSESVPLMRSLKVKTQARTIVERECETCAVVIHVGQSTHFLCVTHVELLPLTDEILHIRLVLRACHLTGCGGARWRPIGQHAGETYIARVCMQAQQAVASPSKPTMLNPQVERPFSPRPCERKDPLPAGDG